MLGGDLAAHLAGVHDFQGLAAHVALDMAAYHQVLGLDRALEIPAAADGQVAPADDGALDGAIDVQLAIQVQFAGEAGPLSDNRGPVRSSLRFTALAKESHLTRSSCWNSES